MFFNPQQVFVQASTGHPRIFEVSGPLTGRYPTENETSDWIYLELDTIEPLKAISFIAHFHDLIPPRSDLSR
ncbi:hypothetical protein BGV50_20385 [Burkholderia ubonensis]|nr:hypothetical protein BGV50_20385 [Burkholderia ubonensis]